MKVLSAFGVIDMTGAQKMRWTPADLAPRARAEAPIVVTALPVPLDPAE
jgi:hypothetical protein